MRRVEKEEERSMMQDPDKPCFHLCIINLVIGTLYCAKVRPRQGGARGARACPCSGWAAAAAWKRRWGCQEPCMHARMHACPAPSVSACRPGALLAGIQRRDRRCPGVLAMLRMAHGACTSSCHIPFTAGQL